MNHEEAIEHMAKDRGCSYMEMDRMICGASGCRAEQCAEYTELRNTDVMPDVAPALVPQTRGSLPDDDKLRLEYPMADGLLYYFPAALAEVSRVSKIGNDQHNPGEPLHWARSKSTDHENKILRHLAEAGTKDSKGVRHTARLAWRALALLQVELEREEGAPLPRNARF